ncbi:MAG: ribonuclease III [Proteobacteria bacterium]|nr:ribonuclease III [Pseudomonadota bacterium]MBU1710852.1 ribonuclease III [Pseudomonadota bacterium]
MTALIGLLAGDNAEPLLELEKLLQYDFKDRCLLQKALIHRSFAAEQGRLTGLDNETLEFLGDAVLDLVVGELLYKKHPEVREGDLTKMRASLVNEAHLAIMARAVHLGEYLFLGKGEDASSGREKASILSCAYEAVAGAIFLDGGYDAASAFIQEHYASWIDMDIMKMIFSDFKSRLQEKIQEKFGETPVYVLDNQEGPDHEKIFTASVKLKGQVLATGQARNKKEAEQQAAAEALTRFDQIDVESPQDPGDPK